MKQPELGKKISASVFYNSVEEIFVMGGAAFTVGSILIVHGIALICLKKTVGAVANYAGVFAIIPGGFFLTVLFSFIGLILTLPLVSCQCFCVG